MEVVRLCAARAISDAAFQGLARAAKQAQSVKGAAGVEEAEGIVEQCSHVRET